MIFAQMALLPEGWRRQVRVGFAAGVIASVETEAAAQAGDAQVPCLVPGMPNLHSHAFQRGFSGLTERRGAARDSFWSWREMMYKFALALDPDGVQALAALAYMEMLEAGFTRVGEFHYLHHAPDGTHYANPAELSARIFAAAVESGIALTHLPVFYAHGGFGPKQTSAEQRRFLHDVEGFMRLVQACDAMARPQDRVGYAPHSLRAVTKTELDALQEGLPGRVVHIHIAEQMKEVEDCLAAYGQRPVAWLLENAPVDASWCLVHATHLTEAERDGIAAAGAVAGLCPVTEANLGDGLFPAEAFLAVQGRIGIGTDSNIRIDVAEELRLLEYGQRLFHRGRNVLAEPHGSSGRRLFAASLAGGAQALGAAAPEIKPGAAADCVALEDMTGLEMEGDALLDRWIFGRDGCVRDVWAAGAYVVRGGRHIERERIVQHASRALQKILQ
jgi:formimidoylglutamate deiminase